MSGHLHSVFVLLWPSILYALWNHLHQFRDQNEVDSRDPVVSDDCCSLEFRSRLQSLRAHRWVLECQCIDRIVQAIDVLIGQIAHTSVHSAIGIKVRIKAPYDGSSLRCSLGVIDFFPPPLARCLAPLFVWSMWADDHCIECWALYADGQVSWFTPQYRDIVDRHS